MRAQVSRATASGPRRYSRRAVLSLGGGVTAAALLGACGGDDSTVVVQRPTVRPTIVDPNATPTPSPTPVPPPEILISTMQPGQGGTMLVSLVGDVREGAITFLDRAHSLTRGQQSMYAFVGVDADDPTGDHPLLIEFSSSNGTQASVTETVTVLPTAWTLDEVQLPPDQTNLLDPKLAEEELELMRRVYGVRTPEKLWSAGWRLPVEGPITTRFGEQRSYNGGPPGGHHGGTDIGAELGTPVGACNSGRVALARQLSIRGNMVVVDHGGGVFSGYAHLSEFSVADGQLVGAGDIIGLVGSTGLSTGAHLHWEMAVGGVLVDAERFVDGTNGF